MRVGGGVGGSAGAVFYADKYHPIQAGSIDGTDVAPHDNAVLRALLCSTAGLCACSPSLPPPLLSYQFRSSPIRASTLRGPLTRCPVPVSSF